MKRDLQENSACQAALHDIRKMARNLETISLQVRQVNSTINSLFRRENGHRKETEEKILINVKEIVLPCLKELKKSPLDADQVVCVELVEKYLRDT